MGITFWSNWVYLHKTVLFDVVHYVALFIERILQISRCLTSRYLASYFTDVVFYSKIHHHHPPLYLSPSESLIMIQFENHCFNEGFSDATVIMLSNTFWLWPSIVMKTNPIDEPEYFNIYPFFSHWSSFSDIRRAAQRRT